MDNQTTNTTTDLGFEVYEYRHSRVLTHRMPEIIANTTEGYAEVLRPYFVGAEQERLVVLYLDNQHRVIGVEVVAQGTEDSVTFSPRDVFRGAVRVNAFAVVTAHNHPNGVLMPSLEDGRSTQMEINAGRLLNVFLVDHLIVGPDGSYFSMRHGIHPAQRAIGRLFPDVVMDGPSFETYDPTLLSVEQVKRAVGIGDRVATRMQADFVRTSDLTQPLSVTGLDPALGGRVERGLRGPLDAKTLRALAEHLAHG